MKKILVWFTCYEANSHIRSGRATVIFSGKSEELMFDHLEEAVIKKVKENFPVSTICITGMQEVMHNKSEKQEKYSSDEINVGSVKYY